MLELKQISLAFGQQQVLKGISLSVATGDIVCLLGESGCGKTSLLRVIAGLERDFMGEVWLDGALINTLPVEKRNMGLMFQDFGLFPHLNVEQNVAFGLKMRGEPLPVQKQQAQQMINRVGLESFEGRDVSTLSGGQKQRVALARSLITKPNLLMLDEPLGSLDATLRMRLAQDLRHNLKENRLTSLYVTHDQSEAFAIADWVAVMKEGRIEQIAPPLALYRQPRTQYVANFLGFNNVLAVSHWQGGVAETAIGVLPVAKRCSEVCIHPDAIAIVEKEGVEAILAEVVLMGEKYRLTARIGETLLHFNCSSWEDVPPIGEAIQLAWRTDGIISLDDSL